MDGGDITEKEFLPVKQVRFGDTGSHLDEKEGRYMLGPLLCEGDGKFDDHYMKMCCVSQQVGVIIFSELLWPLVLRLTLANNAYSFVARIYCLLAFARNFTCVNFTRIKSFIQVMIYLYAKFHRKQFSSFCVNV